MIPGEVAFRINAVKKMRIKSQIGTLKYIFVQSFEINLGWYHDDNTKQQRDQQPIGSFRDELPTRPSSQRKERTGAGNKKQ